MTITLDTVISWVILGVLAGSLAGMVFTRRKKGLGAWRNFFVGLVGAVIGSILFSLLNINLDVFEVTITFTHIVAAFVGSLIFLIVLWIANR